MNYFIYILFSSAFNRTYVGQTNNLTSRLEYHNSGKVRSTKSYRPWTLVRTEIYNSRAEAMKREKWLKTPLGRKFITQILNNHIDATGLSVPLSATTERDLDPEVRDRTKPS
jgi:putative endonuclease